MFVNADEENDFWLQVWELIFLDIFRYDFSTQILKAKVMPWIERMGSLIVEVFEMKVSRARLSCPQKIHSNRGTTCTATEVLFGMI